MARPYFATWPPAANQRGAMLESVAEPGGVPATYQRRVGPMRFQDALRALLE